MQLTNLLNKQVSITATFDGHHVLFYKGLLTSCDGEHIVFIDRKKGEMLISKDCIKQIQEATF